MVKTLTFTKRINAPAGRVFEVLANPSGWAEAVEAIRKVEVLTPGPVGKGTRFRETRVMFGKEATETMEFTEFEPGKGFTIGCESCGVRYSTRHELREENGATELTMRMECRPLTIMTKVMSPVMGLLMGAAMRKCMAKDLEDLKKAVEAR